MSSQPYPVLGKSGLIAITDTTPQYFLMPPGGFAAGAKIQIVVSSSLLGKVAVTSDRTIGNPSGTSSSKPPSDSSITYTNVITVTSAGTAVAAGADVTCVAGQSILIVASGYTCIRFTPSSGTGSIEGIELETVDEITAARTIQLASGSGFTIASNHAEDAAAVSGDTGDTILGVRNDTLATGTSTDGDYSFIATDKRGRVMSGHAPRELKGKQFTTITSSTSETTIVTAVASTFLDLYKLVIANTSASATEVSIRDATGGSVIESFYVPAGDTRGFTIDQDSADPQTTVNNNWTAQCGTSVASIKISAFYTKNI